MSAHPTSLQYRLGVEIGRAIVGVMREGMSYGEVISTLRHTIQVTEANRDLGCDFTNQPKEKDQ